MLARYAGPAADSTPRVLARTRGARAGLRHPLTVCARDAGPVADSPRRCSLASRAALRAGAPSAPPASRGFQAARGRGPQRRHPLVGIPSAPRAGTPWAPPANGAGADIPANEPIGALRLGPSPGRGHSRDEPIGGSATGFGAGASTPSKPPAGWGTARAQGTKVFHVKHSSPARLRRSFSVAFPPGEIYNAIDPAPTKEEDMKAVTIYLLAIIALLVALLSIHGCENGAKVANTPPGDITLSVSKCFIENGGTITLSARRYRRRRRPADVPMDGGRRNLLSGVRDRKQRSMDGALHAGDRDDQI